MVTAFLIESNISLDDYKEMDHSLCLMQPPTALRSEIRTVHVLIIIASRCRPIRNSLESIELEYVLDDLLDLEVYPLLLHLQLNLLLSDLFDASNLLYLLAGVTYVYHRAAFFLLLDVVELLLG